MKCTESESLVRDWQNELIRLKQEKAVSPKMFGTRRHKSDGYKCITEFKEIIYCETARLQSYERYRQILEFFFF